MTKRGNVLRSAAIVLLAVVLSSAAAGPAATVCGAGRTRVSQAPERSPAEASSLNTPAPRPALAAGEGRSRLTLSDDEVHFLARLISGEAAGEPYEGQVAVGAVVMNRLSSGRFGRTLNEVIYRPGQFEAASNGQMWVTAPSASCLEAARAAASGRDPTGGALYFFAPARTGNSFLWSRPVRLSIGEHRFTE